MSVEIKNLTHVYMKDTVFEHKALNNISLTIEDGEFVGLIGHTGSGKSTFIQHLNALLKPSSGSIIIDGINITSKGVALKKIRQTVGLVFQYPEHQLFEETVFKDVAFGPQNLGLPQQEIEARVKEALTLVGLDFDKLKDVSPFELSGGQKRRVAIAGVLAMKPKVLILDEPTAGLDPKGRDEILGEIKKLHQLQKLTVVLVSHSMEDIANLVDRIIVMSKGQIVLTDTPRNVFKQADLLQDIGLDVPQVTHLVNELNKKGLSIKECISVDEAYEELIKYLRSN
ncbi:MAG: energy-coupling factor transporter ATPase [Clostridia bacterium]|jgi:energy-coupling factor transport system ATP-binding protein|nr:energy-coupling factor transporter ATPase [Clostridia bacterium]